MIDVITLANELIAAWQSAGVTLDWSTAVALAQILALFYAQAFLLSILGL